jgi:short-subunit dehydrogenase
VRTGSLPHRVGGHDAGMQIAGSTVLVTGASSGIGAALAPLLAERGATVGIVARREDRLADVLEQCLAHAPGSRMWTGDLGDLDRAASVVAEAEAAFGRLDVLVNNAAIPKRRVVTELGFDEVELLTRVDYLSPVRMALAALPAMLARGSGQIVFVSSVGGRIPIIHESAYNGAKYGLCGFAEGMAVDLAGTGVEVRLVLPGPIATEIWDQPDNDPGLFEIELVPAAECAAGIADAIEADGFEYYVPALFPGGLDAKQMVVDKTTNVDAYVDLMGQVAQTL